MTAERKPFLTWLIIITIVGTALRVFHLNEIPFTYDELSALTRTHFSSVSELIQKGVAGDGHPAGVQVFLYYWVKIVGDAEWVVKLPFIIMGIICIPLVYKIGSKWFDRSTGILAACLMAGLQYPVMFSQIARPYISGLFLILLLALIWNSVMTRATVRNLLAFAVVLALCAYNHYFSMLTAAGMVATGFFVIDRRYLFKYVLSLVLAAVLFLPHLHLFFQQLQLRGLEWVPAPTPGFFKNYLYYIFNFSDYILVALGLLLIQGAYFYARNRPPVKAKFRIIALLWFVIPAAVGYFYSVYRAPVLQNSLLIFGFPFLLIFICSFITLPSSYLRDVEIGGLLLVLVISLTWERSYYTIFYHAETEMFARHISGFEKAYGKDVVAVVNTNPMYLDYYKKKYNTKWSYTTFDAIGDNIAFRKWLDTCKSHYLILCNPPVEWGRQYLAIAHEFSYYEDSIYHGFTTDIYVCRRMPEPEHSECACVAWVPHPPPPPVFGYDMFDSVGRLNFPRLDTTDFIYRYKNPINVNGTDYFMFYGASGSQQLFKWSLKDLQLNEKLILNASVKVFVDSVAPIGSLNMRFTKGRQVIQERKSMIQSFVPNDTGWHTMYLTARMYHTPFANADSLVVDMDLQSKGCVRIKNFRIEGDEDNPIFYSLIKK